MSSYPFHDVEKYWQSYWAERNTFATPNDTSKPKYYVLDMFPYPSGAGLHIGHPEGYTATDIIARYKRMKGFNVLHPMGWDAFGLPTERYSMTTGIHPSVATANNVATFKRQLSMLGFGYDWNREINTTLPEYYKWTQWMFLLLYNSWYDESLRKARPIEELQIPEGTDDVEKFRDEHRLAYIAMIPVNWCEELGTVLANEEVDEWTGKGYTVERRPMRQWMLRITKYADRLLDDLQFVDWVQSTKEMQEHWIGKSEGAEIEFPILGTEDTVRVFTTRPDTVFGATYLVLAPEHPFVTDIVTEEQQEAVKEYQHAAVLKSDLERTGLAKEKTGVFTGGFALNPASGEMIQVWIADYVLAHYGTGAIMAVPGHDERDHEFATQFGLPIIQVVAPPDGSVLDINESAFTENGISMDSQNAELKLTGLTTSEAKKEITQWLERKGIGKKTIQFKLRDWLFSRQRYWGEPIPIIFFEDGTKRALTPDELPLMLPDVADFKPAGTGESALATVESWVNFIDPKTGKRARYETNTMPQWAGSCWYYLRFADPHNNERFVGNDIEKYWMGTEPNSGGVDLYVGGAEHAVLHLLYARFWHKVLFDYGYVSTKEPFQKLFHQGLILGEDGEKMSKSRGNVVNPDDIVAEHGADALRLFEMFLGPLEATKPWSSKGIDGVVRFLNRSWRLMMTEDRTLSPNVQDIPLTDEQNRMLNATIKKIGEDIEQLSFNTAIAQMMMFVNEFTSAEIKPRSAMEKYVLCLASFAPHIAEELWKALGHTSSVALESFPSFDERALVQDTIEIVLQVNSKIRGKANAPAEATQDELEQIALANADVQKHIEGKDIKKKIIVPGKLVNFIVG
ncbi:MAG: leucine--tRNA ligase [Candidatus Kapabacteria bacterium]|nr:leucine--tRNA ligase [Candidatus Kapabacteria bacterium]